MTQTVPPIAVGGIGSIRSDSCRYRRHRCDSCAPGSTEQLGDITVLGNARIRVSAGELGRTGTPSTSTSLVSSLYIQELQRCSAAGDGAVYGEFLPGVTAIDTWGHTPGQVAYAVDSTARPIVFADDALKDLSERTIAGPDSTIDAEKSWSSLRQHPARSPATTK